MSHIAFVAYLLLAFSNWGLATHHRLVTQFCPSHDQDIYPAVYEEMLNQLICWRSDDDASFSSLLREAQNCVQFLHAVARLEHHEIAASLLLLDAFGSVNVYWTRPCLMNESMAVRFATRMAHRLQKLDLDLESPLLPRPPSPPSPPPRSVHERNALANASHSLMQFTAFVPAEHIQFDQYWVKRLHDKSVKLQLIEGHHIAAYYQVRLVLPKSAIVANLEGNGVVIRRRMDIP